jgi:hypothetical protein
MVKTLEDEGMSDHELIPSPKVGQVWRPGRGGMWRTVIGIHPAGVEWTASPSEHAMSRLEAWNKWVRDADARPPLQTVVCKHLVKLEISNPLLPGLVRSVTTLP